MLNAVDIFFALLNFGIFAAICVYLYRRYGRSMLIELMAQQESARKVLELEAVALKQERARLENMLIQDREQARILQEKAAHWHKAQQLIVERQEREQQEINKALEAKAQAQARWYTQHQIAQQLLPDVLKKARTQLTDRYASPEAKSAYTKDILTFLKQGDS